jgi:hypothetical protein
MLNTQIIKFIPPAVNKRNLVYDGEAQPVSHTKFEFKNSDQIRLPVLTCTSQEECMGMHAIDTGTKSIFLVKSLGLYICRTYKIKFCPMSSSK